MLTSTPNISVPFDSSSDRPLQKDAVQTIMMNFVDKLDIYWKYLHLQKESTIITKLRFLLTLNEMNINQYLILDLDLGEDKSIESIEKMN